MNPEQQRIAIAEACGWKHGETTETAYGASYPLKGWRGPNSERFGHGQFPPDYLNDLNAMHEAQKVFTAEQHKRYLRHLAGITLASDCLDEAVDATAAQRAEAFLRTLGLWKD